MPGTSSVAERAGRRWPHALILMLLLAVACGDATDLATHDGAAPMAEFRLVVVDGDCPTGRLTGESEEYPII
jgi:hypothetical protein